jgi:hypothetical protein
MAEREGDGRTDWRVTCKAIAYLYQQRGEQEQETRLRTVPDGSINIWLWKISLRICRLKLSHFISLQTDNVKHGGI